MNRLRQLSNWTNTRLGLPIARSLLVWACFLASFSLATAQVLPASSCSYTLELTDLAADGWDGAYLAVSIDNGTAVNYTVASGSGSRIVTLPVTNGSTIDLNYHSAAFESQHTFQLLDAQGNIVYQDGPSPAEGAVETIKAECPQTCSNDENYVILITVGDTPEEMSWELTNPNGARVAYANAGTYTNLLPGTQIPVAVSLTSCEGYTFTAFDGVNDGWNTGTWQLLSTNSNRGSAIANPAFAGYYEVAAGPGNFVDEIAHSFTLPCLDCPEDILRTTPSDGCEYPDFVFPAGQLPEPVICYPDVFGHGSPAPTMTISYPTATPPVVAQPVGTAVNLPVGSNPVVFEVTYNDGQVVRCTTNVNIVTTMNPTLICNDNVAISLNAPDSVDNDGSGSISDDLGECVLEITPDMVLEMPGFCEREFMVTILDAQGNPMSNTIGPDMIGQTLEYRVNHIASNNVCWGTITVEDKVAPVLVCNDYEIACNHPHALDEHYRYNAIFEPEAGSLPANIAGGGTFPAPPSVTTLDFDIGCTPLGEEFWNVIIDLEINHTDIGDLEIVLIDPLGNTYVLMNANTCPQGFGQNMDVRFSTFGGHPSIATACADGTIAGTYRPINSLFFDEPLAPYEGVWQVVITDSNNTSFPDGEVGLGEVVDAQLSFVAGFPTPVRAYDCTNRHVDLLSETIVETNCVEPWIGAQIERVWRATDAAGNVSTCKQVVRLRTPTFDDLDIPTDVALECGADTDIASTGLPTFDCFDIIEDEHGLCDLSYTYEDTEIPTCGEGRKIIRRWTIINWCSSTTREFNQVIKVEDREGPIITAEDIQTSAATYDCSANIQLSAAVEDVCSEVTQITAIFEATGGSYNALSNNLQVVDITNTGVVEGLPVGTNEVLITARDACGNTSVDTIHITVVDDVPPAAICDDDLHVTLNGTGTARIYAKDVDEGSFDNCGIASYQVRRTDGCLGESEYDDYVDFACCDIGEPVTIELKVTDHDGNSSTCWLPIQIEDKLPPIITCPTDKTIDCDDNFSSLSQFGNANAIDNCEVELDLVETEEIDNCGAGIITRSWTATDAYGNENACTQRIIINHVSDFAVQFPADVTINSCTDVTGDTGEPRINDDDCELIAISHEDQIFDVVPDACFKIIRKWTVINWCTYDLNAPRTNLGTQLPTPRTYQDDGDGYFEYTQVIKVVDNVAPVIDETSVSDVTVNVINGCTETFIAPPASATDDCAGDFTVNGMPSSVMGSPGDDATITYTATDGCGNTDTYTINVTFVDTKKPTPVCINGLSVELMSTGEVLLWASDFEIGSSYDNCTAYEDLKFSFSSDTTHTTTLFTCEQVGTQIVELWATDEAGNQSYCSTYVIIQDNMGSCDDATGASVAIGGLIEDEMGRLVENVTVSIEGTNALPFTTSSSGNYAFPQLGMYGDYDVRAAKQMNPQNGVSTYDLVLISQHILGINPLDSPYKRIAADINNDGAITTFDIVQLRQLILLILQDFPSNSSWRFVDASYVFPDPTNPFLETFPEVLHFEDIDANALSADFVAVKIGDVDGSAIPNSLLGTEERDLMGTLTFDLDNTTTHKGALHTIDFRARDFENILGYQFTLQFDTDALTFVGVESSSLDVTESNFGLHLLEEGVITTSWNVIEPNTVSDNEVLFSLIFDAKVEAPLSTLIGLSARYTQAEAYQKQSATQDRLDIALEFGNTETLTTSNTFELYQNRPNPFNGETLIGFNLPETGEATLSVYDVSGKVLKVIQGTYAKGYNEITLHEADLQATGVLYYALATKHASATKKMIIVK